MINETAFKDFSGMSFLSDLFQSSEGNYVYQLVGDKGAETVFKVLPNWNSIKVRNFSSKKLPVVETYGMTVL